jgi:response regulator RpfG family c-di-GMP phosphodiesterase
MNIHSQNQHKVLLVDDCSATLDLLAIYLEAKFPLEIIKLNSGNSAIEYLKMNDDIDLIVSDFNMDDGNGADLFHYKVESHNHIPFILISSEPHDNERVVTSFKSELSDIEDLYYMSKPFNKKDVTSLVKKVLDHEPVQQKFYKVNMRKYMEYFCNIHDIYISAETGECVRIVEKSNHSALKLLTFYKQEVEYIYLVKADYDDFCSNVSTILSDKLSKDNLTSLERTFEEQNAIEFIKNSLEKIGIHNDISNLVEFIQEGVEKSPDELDDIIEMFDNILKFHKPDLIHNHLCNYLSYYILKETKWNSKENQIKLAYASVFQDCSLSTYEDWTKQFDLKKIQELEVTERKKILQHSNISNDILENCDFFSEDIGRIIIEHHEKPKGGGYPRNLTDELLHPLSSVFILAQALSQNILNIGNTTLALEDFFENKIREYDTYLFHESIKAIRKSLQPSMKINKKTILVVEDDINILNLISEFLDDGNFTICKAQSGKEAIDIIKNFTVDAILSDIKMDDGDGLMLLDAVHDLYDFEPVFYFLSAFINSSIERRDGVDRCFQKPYDIGQVKQFLLDDLEKEEDYYEDVKEAS